jgi:gliding motility-associated-like protein
MKFSPNGSQRLYATYIGGSDNEYPHSLFSDAQGNLVIMGRSYSPNYPGTTVGPNGDCDIVVTKLNAGGTGIIGSLKIGGSERDGVNIEDIQRSRNYSHTTLIRNYGDDSRSEVILDGSGEIYVAAQSQSANFPTTAGSFQPAKRDRQDGVLLKIAANCQSIRWASFIGGDGDDGAFVLDLNPADNDIYVGGGTTSTDLPRAAAGPMGSGYQGGQTDAFVARISNNGTTLRKSVYLGTPNADIVYGLKFDRKGFPYIMGVSRGGAWPVVNAAYSVAGSSQFVAKLDPDLTAFDYSTVFGSGSSRPNMSPVAFLVDRCENVYISGWGGWINSAGTNDPFDQAGVVGMPITAGAIQNRTDNRDFYFIVIQKNASALLYGTFFGQNGGETGEHVDGGTSRFDQQGVIYQAICANCGGGATFPTTPGVIGPVNGKPEACNLAAVKISFDFAGVAAGPRPTVDGVVRDSLGCAPFTVILQDTVRNAVSYEWDFGDGTDTALTDPQVVHTFQNVGTYRVRLIAIDSNSCNERDTAFTTITVGQYRAALGVRIEKLEPCEQLNYRFYNTTTLTPGAEPLTDSSFMWDFGDGTPPVYAGTQPLDHSYAAPGIYNVRVSLVDPAYCNAPQDSVFQLFVNPLVEARIQTPPTGCAPYEAIFTNMSLAGQTFTWNFGDGSPVSNDVNPVHLYQSPGTYTVTLTAVDSGTCNITDDTSVTIVVSNRPTAEFSHTPVVPVQNTPTIFTNLSTGGVRYKWLFGDGDSVVKTTRDTVLHQYNATGTYNACLITYNEFDCTDTVCHDVQADILPLFDVPNAFTPGKFGRNGYIRVEGFGIARMNWTIYNRWGQVVFQTNDRKIGWDGTSKGQPQPMDVYTYTLDVQLVDGSTRRRTGDITLIR